MKNSALHMGAAHGTPIQANYASPTKSNGNVKYGSYKKGRSQTLGPIVGDTRITVKPEGTSTNIGPAESEEMIAKKRELAKEETKGPSGTIFDAPDADIKRDQQERRDYSKAMSYVKK
mgnify:CR=1 FL=1